MPKKGARSKKKEPSMEEQMAAFKQGADEAAADLHDSHGHLVPENASMGDVSGGTASLGSTSMGGRASPSELTLARLSTVPMHRRRDQDDDAMSTTSSQRAFNADVSERNRQRSERISKQRVAQREAINAESRRQKRMEFEKRSKWRQNMIADNTRAAMKSPFAVDLVAETERIDEEVGIRLKFEEQMLRAEARRKDKVIVEVIRSAMTEDDEVRKLREQKRELVLEEKRLKALRDIEKSNASVSRKAELLAETTKQRRIAAALSLDKRNSVLQRVEDERQRKAEALKRRHGIGTRRSLPALPGVR